MFSFLFSLIASIRNLEYDFVRQAIADVCHTEPSSNYYTPTLSSTSSLARSQHPLVWTSQHDRQQIPVVHGMASSLSFSAVVSCGVHTRD